MNNCYRGVFFTILLTLAVVIPAHGTSEHDNTLTFGNPGGLSGFSFFLNDHAITGGQPWHGVSSGTTTDEFGNLSGYIDVKAGRKGSSGVADWFNARADVAIGTRHEGDIGTPSELNFAIIGDIQVILKDGSSALCQDIVIGQGHVGGYNNWWIGAKNNTMYHVGEYAWLECTPVEGNCGGVVVLSPGYLQSDEFDTTFQLCPTSLSDIRERMPRHR